MAVEVLADYSGPYTANALTVDFPFSFIAAAADEIGVVTRDSDGVTSVIDPADYTVTLNLDKTGTVTFAVAPADGLSIIIYSEVSFMQSVVFGDGSGWKAAPTNTVNDRSALRDIWLLGQTSRAPKVPLGDTAPDIASLSDSEGEFLYTSGGKIKPLDKSAYIGMFFGGDAEGKPIPLSGTGADAALRTDLAAGGADLVGTSDGRGVDTRLSAMAVAVEKSLQMDGIIPGVPTATSLTASLQSLVDDNDGAGNISMPIGTYETDLPIRFKSYTNLRNDGILYNGYSAGGSSYYEPWGYIGNYHNGFISPEWIIPDTPVRLYTGAWQSDGTFLLDADDPGAEFTDNRTAGVALFTAGKEVLYGSAAGSTFAIGATAVLLNYDAGTVEIAQGATVTGATSGASGTAVFAGTLDSGTYGGSDAAGKLYLSSVTGTFQDNESLQVSASSVALANGAPASATDVGASGRGINREVLMFFDVESVTAGGVITFTSTLASEFTTGVIFEAAQPGIDDGPESLGLTMNIVRDLAITGNGQLLSDGLAMYRAGGYNNTIRQHRHRGHYGLGGNAQMFTLQEFDEVDALVKAYDIAAASSFTTLRARHMVVHGSGSGAEASTGGGFGEKSRHVHVDLGLTVFINNTSDTAGKFNSGKHNVLHRRALWAKRIGSSNSIFTVGASAVNTNVVNGGDTNVEYVDHVEREVFAGTPKHILQYVVPTIQRFIGNRHDITVREGKPHFGGGYKAILGGGERSVYKGNYPHGDIDVSACSGAVVDAYLGEGYIRGQTPTTCARAYRNGVPHFAGHVYNVANTATGAASFTPNASAGQTGIKQHEDRRVMGSAVTGVTVNAPTNAYEGAQLRIDILNNGQAAGFTVAFNAIFLGLPTIANIADGKRSVYDFIYLGANWYFVDMLENRTRLGAVIPFYQLAMADDYRWTVAASHAVGSGSLTVGSIAAASSTVPTPPRFVSGATYDVSYTIAGRTGGGARVELGTAVPSIHNANGTYTDRILHAGGSTLNAYTSGAANAGLTISAISIREL